jgi:osmoprotectant transport system ATP-binding protein
MIKLGNVSKSYGNHEVIKNLTISFPPNEISVLIGPSGCGKTTTLEMINGLVKPDSGKITVDGKDLARSDLITLRRQIGYVIQEVGLFPHHNIYDNIALVPRLLKWEKNRIKSRIEELMNLVNLSADQLPKYPAQLSGGQQQRVGVARALSANPKYLLMDEPFGALDPINRSRLQDEFLRIQKKLHKTVVFVTHDMDEALKLGNRIAIMKNGELIQFDTPLRLMQKPKNDFVKEFTGAHGMLKSLELMTVADLPKNLLQPPGKKIKYGEGALTFNASLQSALEMLLVQSTTLPVFDNNKKLIGTLSLDRLQSFLRQNMNY